VPGPEAAAILILGGLVAGFINTLAGGGSFLTVPLLILVGLPPTIANGTNRVAVFAQCVAAVGGFRQENVPGVGFALSLLPAALIGSWLGAWLATSVSDAFFGRAFGLVMLLALPIILWNPRPRRGPDGSMRASGFSLPLQLSVYFGIGLYGGAFQAGIGIPLLLALVGASGLDLVRANSVKVAVVAALTLVALLQFVYADRVLWGYGLVLAIGSSAGGYAASRFGARVGDRLIRPVLTITVIILALRLLLWSA
jgi:uncharacterized membrane protein YfcA